MSRQFGAIAVMFISVMAIAIASQWAEPPTPDRSPSSISKKDKTLNLDGVQPSLGRHTQKLRGPLQTSLELIGATPAEAGDVFGLRGRILSNRDLKDIDFKWSLPEGLELVSGQLTGHVSLINAAQPVDIEISVRQTQTVNYQVHFMASSRTDTAKFAHSAQYNTLLQKAFNASKDQLLKSTQKDLAEKQRELKVFH